jgi:hypothetical protein
MLMVCQGLVVRDVRPLCRRQVHFDTAPAKRNNLFNANFSTNSLASIFLGTAAPIARSQFRRLRDH